MYNLFWALIVLFALGALLRMDWVYYLVYVLGGVWIFSHWWVRRNLENIELQRKLPPQAFAGEKVDASLKLINRNWLPMPWIHIQDRIPFELRDMPNYRSVLGVGGQSDTEYAYTLRCSKRGYYEVGPMQLHTGDLFGFVDSGWQESGPTHMTVFPQVLPLQKLGLPSRSPFGTQASRQRIFEDPARLAGVRDYISGDTLRSIHWKASAHENKLLVKKFQPAIALNVAIVLDLNRNAYPLLGAIGHSEWAIIIAASVANHMIDQRQAVGLVTNGLDVLSDEVANPIHARNGRGQLINILTMLARVQMHEYERTLSEWLPRHLVELEWGMTLVVVTPKLDEQSVWMLHNAYRRGSNVVVLICDPDANIREVKAQAGQLGIAVYSTGWERDLKALAGERG